MKTIKQVAELTGVSKRTLQYYDEIGVFKPTEVTSSGYRLYDDEALKTLQQVLFFKELDFQLKSIKEMMGNPSFDKIAVFRKQKELIKAKRDRLDGLLHLLEKLVKGESCMSFKEFDMSEYLSSLEQFKEENAEEVIKNWGSVEAFEQFMENIKDNESEVAKMAIKQYGSIEKYTEAMKKNLSHFSETMEKLNGLKQKGNDYLERNKVLNEQLIADITKDVTSTEIQNIIGELIQMSEELNSGMDMGDNFWDMVIDGYFNNTSIIQYNDTAYGAGASNFIGRAYQYYFNK